MAKVKNTASAVEVEGASLPKEAAKAFARESREWSRDEPFVRMLALCIGSEPAEARLALFVGAQILEDPVRMAEIRLGALGEGAMETEALRRMAVSLGHDLTNTNWKGLMRVHEAFSSKVQGTPEATRENPDGSQSPVPPIEILLRLGLKLRGMLGDARKPLADRAASFETRIAKLRDLIVVDDLTALGPAVPTSIGVSKEILAAVTKGGPAATAGKPSPAPRRGRGEGFPYSRLEA